MSEVLLYSTQFSRRLLAMPTRPPCVHPHGDCGTTDAIEEQLLSRNVERFLGGLVFKAHRLFYYSTLGSRVIKKKNPGGSTRPSRAGLSPEPAQNNIY